MTSSSRVFHVAEWAGAAHDDPESSSAIDSTRDLPIIAITDLNKNRVRSMSHCVSSPHQHESLALLPRQNTLSTSFGDNSSNGDQTGRTSRQGHARSSSVNVAVKGIIRRASMSLKGFVQHNKRHSVANSLDVFENPNHAPPRPVTSHSPWQRLRQAANLRSQRASHGAELERPLFTDAFPPIPTPGSGNEPPFIPENTGAAAKAAAAAQNESLRYGRQTSPAPALRNRPWLNNLGALHKEVSQDRESGIGITLNDSDTAVEEDAEDDTNLDQDTNISRVDFVRRLPVELAIQVLALLDGPGLVTASLVSRRWQEVVSNNHVWREAFMRCKTGTYATGGNVKPGTALGVPPVSPSVDWRELFRIKKDLERSWKTGAAEPLYLNGHQDSIYCLQFDESKIVTGSRDRTIRIWDMHTLQCRLVIGPPRVVNDASMLLDVMRRPKHYACRNDNEHDENRVDSFPACSSFPIYHDASILCLQYDDRILVTGSSDGTCIVYSVKSGYRPIRRLRHHAAAVLDLAFDDHHIVTCSKDNTICVWDRETGNLLRQLVGHSGPVNAVQLRGNTIASCSGDFRVKLWNIDTGKCIREFVGHTKGLACLQFTEDGRFVVSAGNDKAIRVWDANTGECIREIKAHENLVRSLHIDSVSGRLVSGSYDTDIKVFDMETGRQLIDFPRWHAGWVLGAKSDYRRIVSTGQDPKILIMDFGAGVRGVEKLESIAPLEPAPATETAAS